MHLFDRQSHPGRQDLLQDKDLPVAHQGALDLKAVVEAGVEEGLLLQRKLKHHLNLPRSQQLQVQGKQEEKKELLLQQGVPQDWKIR